MGFRGSRQALLGASESGANFALVNSMTEVIVHSGTVGASLGKWRSSFPDTYARNFSSVNAFGSYEVEVIGGISTVYPTFEIGTGAQLYQQALVNALFFHEVPQDGPNVNSSALDRQPSPTRTT